MDRNGGQGSENTSSADHVLNCSTKGFFLQQGPPLEGKDNRCTNCMSHTPMVQNHKTGHRTTHAPPCKQLEPPKHAKQSGGVDAFNITKRICDCNPTQMAPSNRDFSGAAVQLEFNLDVDQVHGVPPKTQERQDHHNGQASSLGRESPKP